MCQFFLPMSRESIYSFCVNAIGFSNPRFYLFKGKDHMKNYIKNCELETCMTTHPNAWMTKELFMNWLYHFVVVVPSGFSPTNRHLLIFYGHGSHIALQIVEVETR